MKQSLVFSHVKQDDSFFSGLQTERWFKRLQDLYTHLCQVSCNKPFKQQLQLWMVCVHFFSPLVTFPLHLLHSYHTSRLQLTGKLFLSLITLLQNSQHADDFYTLILSQFSLAEDPFRWYLAAGLI